MRLRVVLDLDRGIVNFFNGTRLIGSGVHVFSGDDWQTVDCGKLKISSNLWQRDGQWVISAYPLDRRTGYIKLNRPYSIDLSYSRSLDSVAA